MDLLGSWLPVPINGGFAIQIDYKGTFITYNGIIIIRQLRYVITEVLEIENIV